MKFHDNSFGRREKKAIFLSAAALAATLTLTSCADHSELPDLPPLYQSTEDTTTSLNPDQGETTFSDTSASVTEGTSATTETEIPEDSAAPDRTEQIISITENEIPFDVHYIYDENLYDDENIVLKEGSDGYTVSVYRVIYENGEEISRERISFTVTEPISKEIIVGTKPSYTEKTETRIENMISFVTRYEYDSTLEAGITQIKTHGSDGYTESTYRITYYKGNEIGRECVSEKTYAPVDKVIVVGTKEQAFYMPFLDAAHGGYNYPVTQSFSSTHRALDFGVWYGDAICAIRGGKVIAAYDEGYFSKDNILWTYGTYVVIEHDNGMRSYYAHLKSRTVSVGDTVSGGEIIGYSGNTGRVNPAPTAGKPYAGTHLHFEIRVKKGDVYVTTDPRQYLPYWN
ncbi:MAG: G5 domain-containing protein [Clostridia bacterium]|nr:G5 domain-containing protein [Clostridia bacterium]